MRRRVWIAGLAGIIAISLLYLLFSGDRLSSLTTDVNPEIRDFEGDSPHPEEKSASNSDSEGLGSKKDDNSTEEHFIQKMELFEAVDESFVDQSVVQEVLDKAPNRYRFVKVDPTAIENLVSNNPVGTKFELDLFPGTTLTVATKELTRYEEGQRAGFSFVSGRVDSVDYSFITLSSSPGGSVYVRVRAPNFPTYMVDETSQASIYVVQERLVIPTRVD